MRGAKRNGGLMSFFLKGGNGGRATSRSEVDPVPLQISAPSDFKRVAHISYRAATGVFSGLDSNVSLFFGVPIASQPRNEVLGYEERIPSLLILLAKELIKRDGLRAEGIFRVPAESAALERSRTALDCGRGIFSLESEVGPHVIASLIKDWFRSLSPSDCLMATLTATQVAELSAESTTVDKAYQAVCETLSEPNRSVFRWIIDLLAVVCSHSSENLMSPSALATVYAPSLKYVEQTMESFAVMSDVAKVIEKCIKHVLEQGVEGKELAFSEA